MLDARKNLVESVQICLIRSNGSITFPLVLDIFDLWNLLLNYEYRIVLKGI